MCLSINLSEQAPDDFIHRLSKTLKRITGLNWSIQNSQDVPQSQSMAEQDEAKKQAERDEVLNHPIIKEILSVFPDATLEDIKHQN